MDNQQLISLIVEKAESINFPPFVAIEQIKRESANFRPDVVYGPFVGGAGERGMAQFIPGTWNDWGRGNPYNPSDSMAAWAAYTQYLLNLFDGDLTKVLQAYNGGPGNVQRQRVSSAAKRYASEILARAANNSTDFNYENVLADPQPSSNLVIWGATGFILLAGLLAYTGRD